MSVGGINSSQIDSMLSMLRNTAAQAVAPGSMVGIAAPLNNVSSGTSTAKVSFADALKKSLGQVNQIQDQAQKMGDDFASGNNNVSISDVMIATQKANISLQTTVQVRNKMVSAYTDVMNMQI